jgi:leader peptidase (prepilin peptidase)/N-methyltransferase
VTKTSVSFSFCSPFLTFFGACVGSFLNVCIYRIPRDESVVTPRSPLSALRRADSLVSQHPRAEMALSAGKMRVVQRPDLVPLHAGGASDGPAVPRRLPEMGRAPDRAHGAHFPSADRPIYWLFSRGLVLGTFVDFEHFIIPDSVTIGGMVAGPVLSALVPSLHGQTVWWRGLADSGIGLAVGFGVLFGVAWIGEKLFKKEAMGFGDVKLMGAIGAFLGWEATLFTVFSPRFWEA